MAQAVGSAVGVARSATGPRFVGAMPCGLRTCPHCGPRIQAARRDEIARAVGAARARGWRVLFGTLTVRHGRRDALTALLDVERAAWSAVASGGAWKADRERFGIRGFVWVVETKDGQHGWHPHRHFLLFIDPPGAKDAAATADECSTLAELPAVHPEPGAGAAGGAGRSDAGALMSRLFGRWQASAKKHGAHSSRLAQDLHEATDADVDTLAAYFTKETAEELAWEMTGQDTKSGGGSLTPMETLAAAASGQAWFARRWREYEEAQHGRRQIGWSNGLRDLLQLGDELTDEEAAAAADAEPPEVLVLVPRAAFGRLARKRGMRGALLEFVASGATPAEVVDWLALRGIAALLPGAPDG